MKRSGSCRPQTANTLSEWDVASSFGHAKAREMASDRDLLARTKQARQEDVDEAVATGRCLEGGPPQLFAIYGGIKYRLVDFA